MFFMSALNWHYYQSVLTAIDAGTYDDVVAGSTTYGTTMNVPVYYETFFKEGDTFVPTGNIGATGTTSIFSFVTKPTFTSNPSAIDRSTAATLLAINIAALFVSITILLVMGYYYFYVNVQTDETLPPFGGIQITGIQIGGDPQPLPPNKPYDANYQGIPWNPSPSDQQVEGATIVAATIDDQEDETELSSEED